ncbi:MAG: hypothetical protein JST68_23100 [Bacteroidetes bacterium]|nr:hypothetical protein [Bacteroidota bacterium]
MRRKVVYTIAVVIFLLPAWTSFAQRGHTPAPPPVTLKATVDKQKIVIGEPVQLMLEATATGNAPLTWPNLDSLPHFDFVEKGKVDSSLRGTDRYYRQYMTVTSFDSGAWAIPRLPITLGNKTYFSDSVRIEVGYTKFDPSKDYHDIKDIIEVPNPFAKWFAWIVAAVALISIALVVWFIRMKKKMRTKTVTATAAPRLSPYQEALQQLKELQQQNLPENGSMKVYYSRLGDIFRLFLLRRFNIFSLAETSEELITQLRKMSLPAEEFSALSDTLRMSDFVKFAKYQPGLPESEQHFQSIKSSVDVLEAKAAAEAEAKAQAQAKVQQINKPN